MIFLIVTLYLVLSFIYNTSAGSIAAMSATDASAEIGRGGFRGGWSFRFV